MLSCQRCLAAAQCHQQQSEDRWSNDLGAGAKSRTRQVTPITNCYLTKLCTHHTSLHHCCYAVQHTQHWQHLHPVEMGGEQTAPSQWGDCGLTHPLPSTILCPPTHLPNCCCCRLPACLAMLCRLGCGSVAQTGLSGSVTQQWLSELSSSVAQLSSSVAQQWLCGCGWRWPSGSMAVAVD